MDQANADAEPQKPIVMALSTALIAAGSLRVHASPVKGMFNINVLITCVKG